MKTIKIGSQEWTAENFKLGAQEYFKLAEAHANTPVGYRLPTKEDWDVLVEYLGGKEVAGKALKSTEFGGDNSSGFNVLAVGFRGRHGNFNGQGSHAFFWAAEAGDSTDYGRVRELSISYDDLLIGNGDKLDCFSVRYIKE